MPQPHGSTVSGVAAGRTGVVASGGGTGWWHGVVAHCGGTLWWHSAVHALVHGGSSEGVMPSMDQAEPATGLSKALGPWDWDYTKHLGIFI